jgi:formamidopyrimidine-DNA glycosylase
MMVVAQCYWCHWREQIMPELPEVETVRRGLAPAMEDARFVRVEARRRDLRWPLPKNFAQALEGKTVTALSRRAKYLLAELSSGEVLLMHLGMSGSFRISRADSRRPEVRATKGREPRRATAPSSFEAGLRPAPQDDGGHIPGVHYAARSKNEAHDHVIFQMSSGARIAFNDPRRFGCMKLIRRDKLDAEPLLRALGPEPLGNAFDAVMLAAACKGKKTSLKAALSDQKVVAGLGNIYVCEALHRARLSPKRMASTIATKSGAPNERAAKLVDAIKAVLNDAIAAGGSSLRDHRRTSGELGMFQHNFRVYDRAGEPCPTPGCKGTIKRIVQTGRSTFFCPVCQK